MQKKGRKTISSKRHSDDETSSEEDFGFLENEVNQKTEMDPVS